jgi:hypothetical protein
MEEAFFTNAVALATLVALARELIVQI